MSSINLIQEKKKKKKKIEIKKNSITPNKLPVAIKEGYSFGPLSLKNKTGEGVY